MDVKGTAFLARKNQVVTQYGEERWKTFFDSLASKQAFFKNPISALTRIPVADFLSFQEAVTKEFFAGDEQSYWSMGEKSAEWALLEGPYRIYLKAKSVDEFLETSLTSLWKSYYSGGAISCKRTGDELEVMILDLPVVHTYFEYAIMGYFKRSLELLGVKNPNPRRLKGVATGHKVIQYQFSVARPPA